MSLKQHSFSDNLSLSDGNYLGALRYSARVFSLRSRIGNRAPIARRPRPFPRHIERRESHPPEGGAIARTASSASTLACTLDAHGWSTRQRKRRGAMAAKSNTDTGAESSSATPPTEEATETGETVHEAFMKAISGNPRFRPAKPSGTAFVIGAARPLSVLKE